MGVILESARFVKVRWELSDADFRRILTFCTVLLLATAVYAFTSNEEGGSLSGLFRGPAAGSERHPHQRARVHARFSAGCR